MEGIVGCLFSSLGEMTIAKFRSYPFFEHQRFPEVVWCGYRPSEWAFCTHMEMRVPRKGSVMRPPFLGWSWLHKSLSNFKNLNLSQVQLSSGKNAKQEGCKNKHSFVSAMFFATYSNAVISSFCWPSWYHETNLLAIFTLQTDFGRNWEAW